MRAYEEAKAAYDAQSEKQRIAGEQVEALTPQVADFESAYNDAAGEREQQAQYLADEANVEVEPFDPAAGPPTLPEEETEDGGSTDEASTDQNAADQNASSE